ncbi:hypothetical protein ZIOFF_037970 [Zingiber officinale]|uniref:Fucosyltransferase n=1 Tax=Zingiber officinale TaxID=94328 RepID=A0A8J5GC86_ZINOF|nr:hypothetical protein ZIOFF_037970 [Zingiber officinale]
MLNQVMNCSLSTNVLSAVIGDVASSVDTKVKAMVVMNLRSGYSKRIREVYRQQATAIGEVVQVFQPSHEEAQAMEKRGHNVKALAPQRRPCDVGLVDLRVCGAGSRRAQAMGLAATHAVSRHVPSSGVTRTVLPRAPAPAQCFREWQERDLEQCEAMRR